MKKLIISCALVLSLACVPAVAFAGALTMPSWPSVGFDRLAPLYALLHRTTPEAPAVSCPENGIDCPRHGDACPNGVCPADGVDCPRHGDACPNGACPADGTACPRHGEACPRGVCPADGTTCPQHGDACPNGVCPADGLNCPHHGDACPNAATAPQAGTDDRADDTSNGWTCPRSGHHSNGYGHGCGNGAGHGCRR